MDDQGSKCVDDANGMAMLCRIAAQAHEPKEQLEFIDALIADLSEARNDLAHEAAVAHHGPHMP